MKNVPDITAADRLTREAELLEHLRHRAARLTPLALANEADSYAEAALAGLTMAETLDGRAKLNAIAYAGSMAMRANFFTAAAAEAMQ